MSMIVSVPPHMINAKQNRRDLDGAIRAYDEPIAVYREALIRYPSPHPKRRTALNNLAGVLHRRFKYKKDLKDLDEAIELDREALSLPPPPPKRSHSPDKPVFSFEAKFQTKFKKREHPKELDEVIALRHLADVIQTRFEHRGDPKDLDETIDLNRAILTLHAPPHPNRDQSLQCLASVLETRFTKQGDPKDVDDAIELNRETLVLRPPPHAQRGETLIYLSSVLRMRFKQRRDPKDLDEAIGLNRDSLLIFASPNPHRSRCLMTLGNNLVMMYTHNHDIHTLDNAFEVFQEASEYLSSPPLTRFHHSIFWAKTATRHGHSSSLTAYQVAIQLLPQVAGLHLDLPSRQQILSTIRGATLVSGAASFAVGLGNYNLAVEFLEASRSVFWSQALNLRTSMDDLATREPALASKLRKLSRKLEQASFEDSRDVLADEAHPGRLLSWDDDRRRGQRLNKEWDDTIDSVRTSVPGFEEFMKPKRMVNLQPAAVKGPIVILHCGEDSSNAVIITTLGIVARVLLPKLSERVVKIFAKAIRAATNSSIINVNELLQTSQRTEEPVGDTALSTRLTGKMEGSDRLSNNEVFSHIFKLGCLWEWMVVPVFEALKLKRSSRPSRLWWCPTGPFAFLPIHAAGIYNQENTDCVADYVVSSYTPTITALLDPPAETAPSFKMTVIVQAVSKNHDPLPGATQELEKIVETVPNEWLTSLGDTEPATVKTALNHLRESAIVHFACHGTQDLNQPLDSGLILTDGRLRVLEIMQRPENENTLDLKKHMSLAFLSACETAKGDDTLPDEAMHLAATLLFAGFRGVVATMWTMRDQDGPKIAQTFYQHLFKDCVPNSDPPAFPDLTNAAHALHAAVSKLREEPNIPFHRWVPFVHYGLILRFWNSHFSSTPGSGSKGEKTQITNNID
ncbi:CHAT domain-containing protein [Mycena pura]|uniref:CHAT domain-containing protein n=1 Tax=Mycena pura TaxID=153505 RepID=A0AAD6VC92_9AGAR|nr:CHAT domain-containing protein [Mycena pura]